MIGLTFPFLLIGSQFVQPNRLQLQLCQAAIELDSAYLVKASSNNDDEESLN